MIQKKFAQINIAKFINEHPRTKLKNHVCIELK